MKKLISMLLALLTTVTAVGCAKTTENSSSLSEEREGLEWTTLEDSNVVFVENGKSEYKVVIDDKGTARDAAKDMIGLIEKATGAALPMKLEREVTYSADAKYIILGCDGLRESAGVENVSEDLGYSGYEIDLKDNSIFIGGNSYYGIRNGIYGFLEQQIALRTYSEKAVFYTETANMKVKQFTDFIDKPDWEFRVSSNTLASSTRWSLKFDSNSEMIAPINGATCHTSLVYLPIATYQKTHPNWYNLSGEQLCYTARGDEAEYTAMVEKMAEVVTNNLLANCPNARVALIGQMDAGLTCGCDACNEEAIKNGGAVVGAAVKFINKVSERMEKLFEERGVEREIDLLFFAYQDSLSAPVKRNEMTGEYEPYSEDLKARDNVGVYLAPMYAAYTDSFYEPTNSDTADIVKQWNAITDKMYLFLYGIYYRQYLLPFNDYFSRVETMRFFYENGTEGWYDLGGVKGNTAFNALKDYLESKMLWDMSLDYNKVVWDWFDGNFGPAAEAMYSYFDKMTTYLEMVEYEREGIKDVWGTIDDRTIWKYSVLNDWLSDIQAAYKAIEGLKETDPELYTIYYDNIALEELSPQYAMITYNSASFSAADLLAKKLWFKDTAKRLAVTHYGENRPITAMYQEWGIA